MLAQDGRDHDQLRAGRGLSAAARSDVVRGGRHDLGRRAHQALRRRRQFGRAGAARPARRARPRRPSSAPRSARDAWSPAGSRSRWLSRCASTWRSVSTTKPRLTRSPSAAGHQSQAEGAGVPERIEQRRPGAQFVQPLPGPGQVVGFLARRPARSCARSAGSRVASGLRRVERLGADLADMVDAHQRAGVAALLGRQVGVVGRAPRGRAARRAGVAKRVRRALSAAPRKRSMRRSLRRAAAASVRRQTQ